MCCALGCCQECCEKGTRARLRRIRCRHTCGEDGGQTDALCQPRSPAWQAETWSTYKTSLRPVTTATGADGLPSATETQTQTVCVNIHVYAYVCMLSV